MRNLTYLVHSVLSKEELDKRKYAFPEERKFPMPDKNHVLSAIKFFNYVSPSEEKTLAKAILARMKEYGMTDVNVGPDNRFSKYYKQKDDDMNKTYLVHAKGQEWEHHKYIRKEGNKYIYAEPVSKGNKSASPSTPRTQARQLAKEARAEYNNIGRDVRERQRARVYSWGYDPRTGDSSASVYPRPQNNGNIDVSGIRTYGDLDTTATLARTRGRNVINTKINDLKERQANATASVNAKELDRQRIRNNNQDMRAGREEMRANQDAERVEASKPVTSNPSHRTQMNDNTGRIEEARNEALNIARRIKDAKGLSDAVNEFYDNLLKLASVGGNSNINSLINSGRQFIEGLINSRMQAGAKPRSDERTNNHGANLQSLRNRRTHAYG